MCDMIILRREVYNMDIEKEVYEAPESKSLYDDGLPAQPTAVVAVAFAVAWAVVAWNLGFAINVGAAFNVAGAVNLNVALALNTYITIGDEK